MRLDAAPLDTTPLVGRRAGISRRRLDRSARARMAHGHSQRRSEPRRVAVRRRRHHRAICARPLVSRRCRSARASIAATNTFTWAPGVGFVGRYDFVFVRSANGRVVSRRDVRIILHAKGRGAVGPQVVIDAPRRARGGARAVPDRRVGRGSRCRGRHRCDDAPRVGVSGSGGAPIFLGATGTAVPVPTSPPCTAIASRTQASV